MRAIYEEASRVVVWLGDYGSLTRESVDSAFDLAIQVFELMKSGKYTEDALSGLVEDRANDMRALVHIIHRPWFRRVWVIQEVAVCKRAEEYLMGPSEPGFILGHSSILFTELCLTVAAILQA